MQRRCWIAEVLGLAPCQFRPDGQPDMAHLGFTEHYLHKAPTGPKLSKAHANDPRLLRPVCRLHHTRFDFGRLDLTRDDLPASVIEFARDFGLIHKLDREYPKTSTITDNNGRLGADMDRDRRSDPAAGQGHPAENEDVERRAG